MLGTFVAISECDCVSLKVNMTTSLYVRMGVLEHETGLSEGLLS